MKIRKAKQKDAGEIAEILMKESAKKPYNEKYTIKTALKEVKDLFKKEIYIAMIEKEIVGFIASNVTPDNKEKVYIRELWLKPKYQKRGIGKILMNFIEDLYKKKGVKTMRVVAKRKAGAFNFYKRINYYEYKELVFMEKRLR